MLNFVRLWWPSWISNLGRGPSIDHSHQKINSIESVVSDQKIFKDWRIRKHYLPLAAMFNGRSAILVKDHPIIIATQFGSKWANSCKEDFYVNFP
jgi:hypothetical protein